MALAVLVVLAVRLVVLLVVGDEVAEREAVVRGHEVDARDGATAGGLVEIGRARETARELAERLALAAPEVAHCVAVLAVPLRPLRGEVADLVAARADIPGLGDELHLRHDRVLVHEVEEGREAVDVVELARERGGEVEAEPVDVHLGDPVAQRVHDELQRVRVAHVETVAGARVVAVVLRLLLHEAVVRRVVDALEREQGAHVVALGRVVVDDVEDDLDARGVQLAHHALELLHLLAAVAARGVGVVRREEADGVVAPVVAEALVDQVLVVHELVCGHELERGDPELAQVLDDRGVRDGRVGAANLLRNVGVRHREALHVGLVDDARAVGGARRAVALPVEVGVDDDAEHGVRRRVEVVLLVWLAEPVREERFIPVDLAAHGLRVGVEQQLLRVGPLPGRGVVRAVDAVAVQLTRLHLRQVRVPDVGVDLDEVDLRLDPIVVEEAQDDAVGRLAEQGEVRAVAVERRAERIRGTWPGLHADTPLL